MPQSIKTLLVLVFGTRLETVGFQYDVHELDRTVQLRLDLTQGDGRMTVAGWSVMMRAPGPAPFPPLAPAPAPPKRT